MSLGATASNELPPAWGTRDLLAGGRIVGDLERRFTAALRSAWLVYQPIVCARTGHTLGQEALLRTREASLASPPAVIRAGQGLGLGDEVGRLVRRHLAHFIGTGVSPDHAVFFVNTVASDLLDPHLLAPAAALSVWAPRVVLELGSDPALLRVGSLSRRLAALRALGYRICLEEASWQEDCGVDVLGLVDPDIVRLAREVAHDIDFSPDQRRRAARTIARASARGCLVVAGLVETAAERDTLLDLGVDLLQGYLLHRPAPWRAAGTGRAS